MCKNNENKTLEVLLKIFLVVGIVAGIAAVVKLLLDKYKDKMSLLYDDDSDCNFECLENDSIDCDCDSCEFNKANCCDEAEFACETETANDNVETAETAEAFAE